MVFRVLQFLIGAVLAGGGGFLAWTHRADAAHVFPPGAAGLPVLLLAGLAGVTSGIVLLVSAVHPRPNQRRLAAEKAERDDAALGQAEAYYSERARAADRDWRSGDITPLAPPAPPAEPPKPVVQPLTVAPPLAPEPAPSAEPTPPRGQRSLSMPPAAPAPAPARPAEPKPAPAETAPAPKPAPAAKPATPSPSPFPAQVTLSPLPRASEPPPAAAPHATVAAAAPVVTPDDPHADIRAAINAGRLDEADRMLTATRDSATGMDLAQLTALAGDHAAVSGKQSHAKWLWRLALKRFGELDAMNSPAAKAVAESLRQAG
jgi:hypothetical protein